MPAHSGVSENEGHDWNTLAVSSPQVGGISLLTKALLLRCFDERLCSGPMKGNGSIDSAEREPFRLAIIQAAEQGTEGEQPVWEDLVLPLGLRPDATQVFVASLCQLRLLPFANPALLADLLYFRYVRLPAILGRGRGDLWFTRLASLFELMVDMSLQGNSLFPQNPADIARQVQHALQASAPSRKPFDVLMSLLLSDGGKVTSGVNFAKAKELNEVVQYERRRRSGSPEWCWKATHKYDLFVRELKANREFQGDWNQFGANFNLGRYRDAQGIIRRLPLVEGNWRKTSYSDLKDENSRFQVAFDFFCWKWFLYGMQQDVPMPQKLAVTLTPFGTQIFIPGFWSLDPVRDINWAKVTRLHRARGIPKQGEKLADNRRARAQLVKRIQAGDQAARKKGLRGEARYRFIKTAGGLSPDTDNAEVRHYLREAKRQG